MIFIYRIHVSTYLFMSHLKCFLTIIGSLNLLILPSLLTTSGIQHMYKYSPQVAILLFHWCCFRWSWLLGKAPLPTPAIHKIRRPILLCLSYAGFKKKKEINLKTLGSHLAKATNALSSERGYNIRELGTSGDRQIWNKISLKSHFRTSWFWKWRGRKAAQVENSRILEKGETEQTKKPRAVTSLLWVQRHVKDIIITYIIQRTEVSGQKVGLLVLKHKRGLAGPGGKERKANQASNFFSY